MVLNKVCLLTACAAIVLSGCGKNDEQRPATLADAAAPTQAKATTPVEPKAAVARGDASTPLQNYQEIKSGKQLMYAFLATSTLPIDYEKIAGHVSSEFRYQQDEFKKRDMLNALKPAIEAEVGKAKQSRYYVMRIGNGSSGVVEKYDFAQKQFPLPDLKDSDSYRYFNDVSDYKLGFSNARAFNSLNVPDENAARTIENLRSTYQPLSLLVYFFASETELGENKLKGEIMKVQLVDKQGTVLAQQ